MHTPYPLNPVITTDATFSERYDRDLASLALISACLHPEQAEQLLDHGAQFESVVLLNGAGAALRARLHSDGGREPQKPCRSVMDVALPRCADEGVALVHEALGGQSVRGFFCAGG